MDKNNSEYEISRTRLLSLIQYLIEFVALGQNDINVDYLGYNLGHISQEELPLTYDYFTFDIDKEDWLKLSYIDLPSKPVPPTKVHDAFEDVEFINYENPPVIKEELYTNNPKDMKLVDEAQDWVDRIWKVWSIKMFETIKYRQFYRRFFDIAKSTEGHQNELELVWGFGEFSGRFVNGKGELVDVRYPLLTVQCEASVDVDGVIAITPTSSVSLESSFLKNLVINDRGRFAQLKNSIATTPFSPWETQDMVQFLDTAKQIIVPSGQDGIYLQQAFTVKYGWSIFLRPKSIDYEGFLEDLYTLYQNPATIIPEALLTMVNSDYIQEEKVPFDEKFLLPLSSNDEQLEVLKSLAIHSGVVVQGPPGTGKTHTIANIVSNYLSTGKRILVVSEKEQALTVLREKIPADIRDLVVTAIGKSSTSKNLLENSVRLIQEKCGSINIDAQIAHVDILKKEIADISEDITKTENALIESRKNETRVLEGEWSPGTNPSLMRVNKWLQENNTSLGLIRDNIPLNLPLPCTVTNLFMLINGVAQLGYEKMQIAVKIHPESQSLPSSTEILDWLDSKKEYEISLESIKEYIKSNNNFSNIGNDLLTNIIERLTDISQYLANEKSSWENKIINACQDEVKYEEWLEFINNCKSLRVEISELSKVNAPYEIHWDATLETVGSKEKLIATAYETLAKKGKFTIFDFPVTKVLKNIKINDVPVATLSDLLILENEILLAKKRTALLNRWKLAVGKGSPEISKLAPEDEIYLYINKIELAVKLDSNWDLLKKELLEIGFKVSGGATLENINSTLELTTTALNYFTLDEITKRLDKLTTYLNTASDDKSSFWSELSDMLLLSDFNNWDKTIASIKYYEEIQSSSKSILEIYRGISEIAPLWADTIIKKDFSLQDAELAVKMWEYAQLRTYSDSETKDNESEKLSNEVRRLSRILRNRTAELITAKAWLMLNDKMGPTERDSLNAYVNASKKRGKGTGKYALRYLNEMKNAMKGAQKVIPVWVMTVKGALETFSPAKKPEFDLLIIDEASQIGIWGVALLSLASNVLVVGDDKQTSPLAIGLERGQVNQLIDTLLSDIPYAPVLFTPESSIYMIAQQKFRTPIMLKEHFRCLPEIIAFSNTYIYDNRIDPLRVAQPSPNWTQLGSVFVKDGKREREVGMGNDVNINEARAVVNLIKMMLSNSNYDGMSIGVIALLGGRQADLINSLIFDTFGPKIFGERLIRVGDATNFQGDERDIIIISLVVSEQVNSNDPKLGAMTKEQDRQRFNVAASRARNQMWVVHSLPSEVFHADDLRGSLIAHVSATTEHVNDFTNQEANLETEFEHQIFERFLQEGYTTLRTKVRIGSTSFNKPIDIIIEGPNSKLGIMLEDDQWVGEERFSQEIKRQRILERSGWVILRISASSFYKDKDRVLELVNSKLLELGIPKDAAWTKTEKRKANLISFNGELENIS